VPSTAVVKRHGEPVVFVVPDGESVTRMIRVKTGIVTPESTEILVPQLRGRVVTLGQHLLDDGSPVMINEAAPTSPGEAESATEGNGAE
jgi:hypothetical protein